MMILAKWIVLLFGMFIFFAGFLMLLNPKKARELVGKAGSTTLVNYGEITVRMFVAMALLLYSGSSKFPAAFEVLGWFMLLTSLILYFVPKKVHHRFSRKSADVLKPFYFQLISPLAFLFGILVIYNAM